MTDNGERDSAIVDAIVEAFLEREESIRPFRDQRARDTHRQIIRWRGELAYDAAVEAGMEPPGRYGDLFDRLHAEIERLREGIRHEYREARAHRTDNRTALTRLYRLVESDEIRATESNDG